MNRRSTLVVLVAVLAGLSIAAAVLQTEDGDGPEASLPPCSDLTGRPPVTLGEDPAWGGCLTGDGAAVQSYRYECTGLREVLPPDGEERQIAQRRPWC